MSALRTNALAARRWDIDRRRAGITRVELVVVIGLCVVAAGLGVLLIVRHREMAQREQCKNNLRQIGQAIQAYHAASAADEPMQRLPPSYLADGYATWAVLLAPHLTKEHPLQKWDTQLSYFAQPKDVREARLILFFCPTRIRADTLSEAGDLDAAKKHVPGALGDYASVAGDSADDWTGPTANGALIIADVIERKDERILKWQSRTSFSSLTRGMQYTLIVGEKHVPPAHLGDAAFGDGSLYNGQNPASFARIAGPGFTLAPAIDAPFNNNFGSYHNGVVQFLNADGSVRTLTPSISEVVLGQLARRGE